MAAIIAAVVLGQIVGAVGAPADIESDSLAATVGTLNFHVETMKSGASGYITINVPQAVLATLVPGPATLVISQGIGTLPTVTATQ